MVLRGCESHIYSNLMRLASLEVVDKIPELFLCHIVDKLGRDSSPGMESVNTLNLNLKFPHLQKGEIMSPGRSS